MNRWSLAFDLGPTFVPFFVLGHPTLEDSLEYMESAVAGGARALELGLPFSDPVADGPVIQTAAFEALQAGFRVGAGLDALARFRRRHPGVAIGLLVYAQLVRVRGFSAFYAAIARAGADACLVADAPVREATRFDRAATDAGVDPVHIAPPNAAQPLLRQVAETSRSFVYCVCRPGVTGDGTEARLPSDRVRQELRAAGAPALVAGFGLSTPEHVAGAAAAGFEGAIVGSAIVRQIQNGARPGSVEGFVRDCVHAAASARKGD